MKKIIVRCGSSTIIEVIQQSNKGTKHLRPDYAKQSPLWLLYYCIIVVTN